MSSVATSWWRLLIGNHKHRICDQISTDHGRHFLVAAIDWKPVRQRQRSGNRQWRRHFLVAAIDWKPLELALSRAQGRPVATSWWRLLIGNLTAASRIPPVLSWVATSWWRLLIGNVSAPVPLRWIVGGRHFLVAAIDWKPRRPRTGGLAGRG